jgi:SET family sugar efflux transporter-like MFS transporter
MIVVGRLAGRIGKLRLVAAAMVIAIIFFCLLPVAGSTPILIALQLPNALWTAVIMSIPMVIVQQEVPGGSGTASALYSSTFMIAGLLAGAITGVVAAQAGYRNVFWICAGLCVIAAALLLCRMASRVTVVFK